MKLSLARRCNYNFPEQYNYTYNKCCNGHISTIMNLPPVLTFQLDGTLCHKFLHLIRRSQNTMESPLTGIRLSTILINWYLGYSAFQLSDVEVIQAIIVFSVCSSSSESFWSQNSLLYFSREFILSPVSSLTTKLTVMLAQHLTVISSMTIQAVKIASKLFRSFLFFKMRVYSNVKLFV